VHHSRLPSWILPALAIVALNANADIKITPANLPDGAVGVAYSATLKADGCAGGCTWSTSSTLPGGLSLAAGSGTISGTPETAGTFHFTITAKDQKSQSASQSYTLTIFNAPITINSTSPLPDGKVGNAYSQTLSVSGGVAPYTWTVIANALPAGISLNASSGALSGTPTAAGDFSFTVKVVDKNQASTTKAFTLTVAASTPPLKITAASLPGGTVGVAYSQSVTAAGGATPYTWTAIAGSLPPGLSLNPANGSVTGTPSSAGTFNFTAQVRDSNNATASQAFTVTIANATPNLAITTASPLPAGTIGAAYSQNLVAVGGTPPYSWSLTSGALPNGLGLNSATGAITGTPANTGTSSFTVRVTDRSSAVADQSFQLTVASAPPPPAAPTLSFSGVPDSAGSGVQMPFNVVLSSAAPQTVTGQVILTFQPDAAAAKDDPAIQFSTGSRSVSFTIPAGATNAVFPSAALAFQTGTVAGTLNLAVSSNLPNGNVSHSVVIPRAGPIIAGASVTPNSSGFQLQVAGFSNTRELAGASFHFTAAPGQTLQTSDLNVSLASLAGQWYTSSASTPFGGQFLLVVPFSVSQGAASGLASVTVQLQNGQSASAAATAKF